MIVQDHLHLAATLGAAPENAPIYTWKATKRGRKPVMQGRVATSLQGYVYAHVVKRSAVPVVRYDYRYSLLVRDRDSVSTFDWMDRLEAMLGKELYLVDHRHSDDGTDHTADIQSVWLEDIGEEQSDVNNLAFFYVPIVLRALSTTP